MKKMQETKKPFRPCCHAIEADKLRAQLALLQAREFLLAEALHQAQQTVQFLHGCLTDPKYKYAYPEQTEQRLEEWAALAPLPATCHHSFTKAGCESCADRNERGTKRLAALAALQGGGGGDE
jgi:hypothetical protein